MYIIKISTVIFIMLYAISSLALPNPASVHCAQRELKNVMIKETGICIFSDGSYCEEWSFFRRQCAKGENTFPGGKYDKNKPNQYCIEKTQNQTKVILCL